MTSEVEANTLKTERLILRRGRAEDAVVFRLLWTERDPRVPPHRRIGVDGRPTEEDIADHIQDEPGLLTVVREDKHDVIGYCGLVFHGNGQADEPELAFELLSTAHNRGYATEAAQAVIAWAGEAGYQRLWATVWDWNVASRRVLEKLGFRDTGAVNPETAHGRTVVMVREA